MRKLESCSKLARFGLLLVLSAVGLPRLHGGPRLASAPPALLDNMDGDRPILRPITPGSEFRLHRHEIDRQAYRFGSGAERISMTAPGGRQVEFGYKVPNFPIIRELRIVAWIQSNRPGVQLAVRVALPRSLDPATGAAHEVLVGGSTIHADGNWQRLVLDDLPLAVQRRSRVERAQHGSAIDERGAYVSQVVLVIPGGQGATEVRVDRLEVHGAISARHPTTQSGSRLIAAPSAQPPAPTSAVPLRLLPPINTSIVNRSVPPAYRTIQWQGEPFELLAKLGFDAVRMGQLPTAEQAREATRLGLSLVCPPPGSRQITEGGIGPELSAVAVWEMGDQLSVADLDPIDRWKQLLRRHDPVEARPMLISSKIDIQEASRIADIVLLDRPLLASDLTLRDYATWLTRRDRLARPGTPIWAKIDTQYSPLELEQITALNVNSNVANSASYAQLSAITAATLVVPCRGFYFGSNTSLADDDPATRYRAQMLELINLRLGLIRPWLAQGKTLASARSSRPDLSALVFRAERSFLLAPIRWSQNIGSTPRPSEPGPVSFLVPSVAESSDAYLITLGGPQRLRHKRVTGGIRVEVDTLPNDGLLLLTDDSGAFSQVSRYLRNNLPRAAQLRRELAAFRLQQATDIATRIGRSSLSVADVDWQKLLTAARQQLQTCDQSLAAKRFDLAYQQAEAAELALDQFEHHLRQPLDARSQVVSSPWNLSLATLPDQQQLQRSLARAPTGTNQLADGGFENLSSMLDSGWRHRKLLTEGVTTAVRLSPTAPHSGTYCLELEATAIDATGPPPVVSNAPVWIVSAPIKVRAGDLIEITGVVRVPQELIGTIDGVQIIDSLGGPGMALRIDHAPSWQPFRLLRVATTDTQLTVTIALSGLGKAQFDDVALRTVRLPNLARGPQAGRPSNASRR